MLLFGYIKEPAPTPPDDVQCRETLIDCVSFERPLVLASELHVAGAMAFANSHGFRGISLAEWALVQSLHSAAQRLDGALDRDGTPPSSRD